MLSLCLLYGLLVLYLLSVKESLELKSKFKMIYFATNNKKYDFKESLSILNKSGF